MEQGNERLAKRARNDTFWCFSDEQNAQYFNDIYTGKSRDYRLEMQEVTKLDWDRKERECWRVYSIKTGGHANSIRSTKPYRLSLIWSIHFDYWETNEQKKKLQSNLPRIDTKRGDHSRHLCGNDWCCNPSHIEIGSRSSNEVDKHFHYFLNHHDASVRARFVESFPDLMRNQGVW